MKIAVTGASGLIGSALVPALREQGHDVLRLVRRPARSADEATWDPRGGAVDLARLAGTDAVIHLAGVGIAEHRWTTAHKSEIRRSRTQGTTTIARALAGVPVETDR